MGARAQVFIKDEGVYLYTHWGSGSLVEDVRTALASPAGQGRLNDPEYLARIIFDVMQHGNFGEETGYGIGTTLHCDNDYAPIVIDCAAQKITVQGKTSTFTKFING